MPIVLVLHCAFFDIIQCAEALAKCEVPAPIDVLDGMLSEWWTFVRRTGLLDDPSKPRETTNDASI